MAIQFNCPSCTQPIEVDDEVAGQAAACPYCGKVVTVPQQSTYRPAVSARPLGEAGTTGAEGGVSRETGAIVPHAQPSQPPDYPPLPPYHQSGLHVGPSPDARGQSATTLGNIALGCAGVVIALWVTQFVLVAPAMMASTSQPSHQEAMRIMQTSPNYAYAGAAGCAALVLSMFGAALAGFSLRQRTAGNWRGWVSIVVCGGTLTCGALSALLTMASGAAL